MPDMRIASTRKTWRQQRAWLLLAALLVTAPACQKVYYAGLEKVGIPKRDLLERRVEKAQESQQEVKEQVTSALDRFRATITVDGGAPEERYDALREELGRSESRSKELQERIENVANVAEALFQEWEDELDDYKRPELRAASERRLAETRRRYQPMIASMRRAHDKVEPVLDTFRDVVLAMKHQLNAKAVTGMEGELATVEREVDALVKAMNASIEQAGAFLSSLEQGEGA